MGSIWKDLRYAFRSLLRQPGFAMVAVITLALGIGANTAVFSVVKAVLLNPLPYDNPKELAVVWTNFGRDLPQNWISGPEFVEIRKLASTIQSFEVIVPTTLSVSGDGEPEEVSSALVSGGFLQMMGTDPELGRLIIEQDDGPGSAPVAVLSRGFWERRYGSDPTTLGKTMNIDGFPVQIVGVLPADFEILHPNIELPENVDLWLPLSPVLPTVFGEGQYEKLPRGSHFMCGIARLEAGITMQQFQADLDSVAARMKELSPDYYDFEGWGLTGMSLHDDLVEQVRPALLILMGAVAFVLLIACVNVANLLLARAASREREIAIRTALGAGRARLLRQLLTESLTLSAVGAVAGLLLALALIRVFVAVSPEGLPRGTEIGIDLGVLGFTLGIALLTGLLFGLAPAAHGLREQLVDSLKEGGRGASRGMRNKILRACLVVSEVALALVLLIGAGLMIQSFNHLLAAYTGYSVENRLTLRINLPTSKYGEGEQIRGFQSELLKRVSSLPGVEAAGLISELPLSGSYSSGTTRVRDSLSVPEDQRAAEIDRRQVSPEYFQTMGMRLLRGRLFNQTDRADAPLVAIVDDAFVRRFWPNEDPLGQYVSVNSNDAGRIWREVVGVVSHTKHYDLSTEGREQVYFPLEQRVNGNFYLAVKAAREPVALASAIRSEIWAMDPDQPISDVRTMDQRVQAALSQPRFNLVLLGFFAVVALTLSAVGIYGVISYSVSQRNNEIGVRMALGADSRGVQFLVLRQGMAIVGLGLILGVVATVLLSTTLRAVLFDVPATDPLTYAGVTLLLALVAVTACYLPARRATRIDPVRVLHSE